ncbi:MAG: hypothetical protein RR588_02025 [Solibacillus sp.]
MSVFKPKYSGEGGPLVRLREAIQVLGYNEGGDIRIAEVTSEYPNFAIQVQSETIETPAEGIICNPDLFQRTETVKINGIESTIEYPNRLVKGAKVYVFEPEHQQLLFVLTMAE